MEDDKNTDKNSDGKARRAKAWKEGRAKEFKAGESGNPAGRPKGAKDGLRAQLRRLLKSKAPPQAIAKLKASNIDCGEDTMGAAIMGVLSAKALSGDLGAIKEVVKQTEKAIPAISMSANVEKEDLDPYIDSESQSNGDKPKASHTNALSPNATEIAAALDRE